MFSDQLRKLLSGITTSIGKTLGKIGIHANFVTFLVLIFGFWAGYYIYIGEYGLAILMIIISGICDGIDGAVAKANQKETKFGALLDSTTDKVTEISWYLAFIMVPSTVDLTLPAFLACSAFMVASYISKHAKADGGKSGGGLMERKERLILIIIGLLSANNGRIDVLFWCLWAIAIGSSITALQRFYKNYKILSEMK